MAANRALAAPTPPTHDTTQPQWSPKAQHCSVLNGCMCAVPLGAGRADVSSSARHWHSAGPLPQLMLGRGQRSIACACVNGSTHV